MIRRSVVYSPEARDDLLALQDWIADKASSQAAESYLLRITRWLSGFDLAAERGALRDDLYPGLRIIGFERRVTVAFTVATSTVTIARIFYGGQDWAAAFEAEQ